MTTDTTVHNTDIADATDTNDIESAGAETTVDPMRVLKVATTSSLSNRSTLGYAIGCDDSNAIFIGLRSNTAAGMFSPKWVAYLDIAQALVQADRITSSTLSPLYEYTSRNNAGFMLAVLLGEGLVSPFDRYYVPQDFKPFVQQVNALITAGVDLGDADEALEALETVIDVPEIAAPPMEIPTVKRGRPSKRT
jgi:hypothetical protein